MIKLYKNRILDPDKPVQVYKNLHKNQWSIKQGSLVIAHADNLIMRQCKFKVNETGRQKVLKTQSKNVHAVIEGFICDKIPDDTYSSDDDCHYYRCVSYNPYKFSFFYDKNDYSPIYMAGWVDMDVNDIDPVIAIFKI